MKGERQRNSGRESERREREGEREIERVKQCVGGGVRIQDEWGNVEIQAEWRRWNGPSRTGAPHSPETANP